MAAALNWRFDTRYTGLPPAFFTRLAPTPVKQPRLVMFNAPLAEALGLGGGAPDADALAALFSGNRPPADATPFAQAYAGHQFGGFTMLGDGRAIVLGEHLAPDGRRFDIQFKGSGPTPYSRRGDGRAALGPMLREYVISEAMAALGVPTTRSLAVVATGEPVFREDVLPGAVLTRVAASHIRVGTFEFAAARDDPAGLRALLEHAIARHDPDLDAAENPALALLGRVIERQADLIVEWMRIGFVHGVMNTDNMTISGETIDYGPCAFIDAYDPAATFSSIDHGRRYAFGAQPGIAQWNLARFAEALLPVIDPAPEAAVGRAEEALARFAERYRAQWLAMMRRKLGLFGEEEGDSALAEDLLAAMGAARADYTNSFRALAEGGPAPEWLAPWRARWEQRRARNGRPDAESDALMRAANPAFIPRNHKVEEALGAAAREGDLGPLHALLSVLSRPYEAQPDRAAYAAPNPAPAYRTFCGT